MSGHFLWAVWAVLCSQFSAHSANSFNREIFGEQREDLVLLLIQARQVLASGGETLLGWVKKQCLEQQGEEGCHCHVNCCSCLHSYRALWGETIRVLFLGWLGENLNLSPEILTCVSMWAIQTDEGGFIHSVSLRVQLGTWRCWCLTETSLQLLIIEIILDKYLLGLTEKCSWEKHKLSSNLGSKQLSLQDSKLSLLKKNYKNL